MKKNKNLVQIFTLSSGICCLLIAFFYYFSQDIPQIKNSVRGEAIIIDYKKFDKINYPILKFLPENSKDSVTFLSQEHNLMTGSQKKVKIIYDATNPNNVYIFDSYVEYGIPISIFIIGMGLMSIYLLMKKYEKNN